MYTIISRNTNTRNITCDSSIVGETREKVEEQAEREGRREKKKDHSESNKRDSKPEEREGSSVFRGSAIERT